MAREKQVGAQVGLPNERRMRPNAGGIHMSCRGGGSGAGRGEKQSFVTHPDQGYNLCRRLLRECLVIHTVHEDGQKSGSEEP